MPSRRPISEPAAPPETLVTPAARTSPHKLENLHPHEEGGALSEFPTQDLPPSKQPESAAPGANPLPLAKPPVEAPPIPDVSFDDSLLPPLKPKAVEEPQEPASELPPLRSATQPKHEPAAPPKMKLPPPPPLEDDLLPPLKPKVPDSFAPPAEEPLIPGPGVFDLDAALLPPMKPKGTVTSAKPVTPAKRKFEGFPADEDTPLPPMKAPANDDAPSLSTLKSRIDKTANKPVAAKPQADDLFASLFSDGGAGDAKGKQPVKTAGKPNAAPSKAGPASSKDQLEELGDFSLDLGVLDLFPGRPSGAGRIAASGQKPASGQEPGSGQKPASKPAASNDDPLNLAGILNLDDPEPPKDKKSGPPFKDKGKDKDKKNPSAMEDFDITKFEI